MKRKSLISASIAFGLMMLLPVRAETIVWTNATGGNWSSPLNWQPNQVPAETDTAVITNRSAGGGPLTVVLDSNRTVGNLTLGTTADCDGGQQLLLNGQTLVFNDALTIGTCGQLVVNSGTLAGGTARAAVSGVVNWTGGRLGGTITIGPAGTLGTLDRRPDSWR